EPAPAPVGGRTGEPAPAPAGSRTGEPAPAPGSGRAADPDPAPVPGVAGGGGGGGFFTTLSRSRPTISSIRPLSTSAERGRLRSCTQYELPSAIASTTTGACVAVPVALRSMVIVAVGFAASRLASAGDVSSIVDASLTSRSTATSSIDSPAASGT